MSVVGLIFSNIHDSNLPELTSKRTMASVPYGCRYRLIDFPLSNMVNSGITKIGVIAHNNYQSLLDHIGTGKDWDLARRSGGIKILPPFISAYAGGASNKLYTTRLEALYGVMSFISRCNEDYVVFSDCDGICNLDLAKIIDEHTKRQADVTIVTRKIAEDETDSNDGIVISFDENSVVTDVSTYVEGTLGVEISTNIVVINRLFLLAALKDASAHGETHFYHNLIAKRLRKAKIYRHLCEEQYVQITSLESYFSSSMKLLESNVREKFFNVENRPIFTKLRNSAPTVYANGSNVKNSCIADGCLIEGTVENCIVFRGVKVGRGAVVKNSVLLQDTFIGNNVSLNCVISDKNAVVCDGRVLSGHSTMPFFIPKGTMV